MARRHGQDRGGEQDCGYAASLGQRKRVAHIPTADAKAAGSCLILKDKGRRDYTLTPAPPGPTYGVHFKTLQVRSSHNAGRGPPRAENRPNSNVSAKGSRSSASITEECNHGKSREPHLCRAD